MFSATQAFSDLTNVCKKEIHNCLYDVCDLVREALFSFGEEMDGAAEMRIKYRSEALERRQIFNKMLTLQGRIRVMVSTTP